MSGSDPLLIRYCESEGENTTIETTYNTANIRFTSDSSVSASGFQLYWEGRKILQIYMSTKKRQKIKHIQSTIIFLAGDLVCGRNISDDDFGYIDSPFYPDDYPNNADCEWVVTMDLGKIVQFDTRSLNLDESCCGCDFVEIRLESNLINTFDTNLIILA